MNIEKQLFPALECLDPYKFVGMMLCHILLDFRRGITKKFLLVVTDRDIQHDAFLQIADF